MSSRQLHDRLLGSALTALDYDQTALANWEWWHPDPAPRPPIVRIRRPPFPASHDAYEPPPKKEAR